MRIPDIKIRRQYDIVTNSTNIVAVMDYTEGSSLAVGAGVPRQFLEAILRRHGRNAVRTFWQRLANDLAGTLLLRGSHRSYRIPLGGCVSLRNVTPLTNEDFENLTGVRWEHNLAAIELEKRA